ncbi:MAG: hypothetical protein RLZZ200_1230 [Pseudomonadota bacterium]|jgi:hypothetical protein
MSLRVYIAICPLLVAAMPLQSRAVERSSPVAGEAAVLASRKSVLALEHQLLQARVSADPSIHEAGFAPEGIYMHSSGRVQGKAEVLKMVAERPWVSWSKTGQQVQIFGDTAVTHSLLSVRLTDGRTETVRATGVYVNQSGGWRQVSWQSSAGQFTGPTPASGN